MGVLGGAFNPPHIGHLVLAQEAAHQLGLERVLLVPAREAPHKRIEPEPGPEVRLEMAHRAAGGSGLFEASEIEVAREGPSYTFRTLELLHEQRPEDELWFVMGADVASGLGGWKRPERVLELAQVAIAGRPGAALEEAKAVLERLGGRDRAELIEMPEIAVSSSGIRERIARGEPIAYLVPDPVIELIAERGLYLA